MNGTVVMCLKGKIQDNLVLSAELIMKIGLRKDFLKVTFRASFALTKG